jgi:hypothetical protein
MIVSALITLSAVVLGWFLGQGATLLREWRSRRRILKALTEELLDCESYVRRNLISTELLIQTIEVKAFLGFSPILVPQTVFDRYYGEIVMWLTRGERMSFAAIYARLDQMNGMCEQIVDKLTKRDTDEKALASFAELAAAFHITARITLEMIVFHRRHGRKINPWSQDTAEAKKMESDFMAEVVKLRVEASQFGYQGVKEKILAHE